MRAQLMGFRQSFRPLNVEFLFVDAPFQASGPAHRIVAESFKSPFYEWWNYVDTGTPGQQIYEGWNESLDFVQNSIESLGSIDVVLGFSQGAAMTTLLTAHYIHAKKEIPYKAVVLCCGKLPLDGIPSTFNSILSIPSIHILGKQDSRYEYGLNLAHFYEETTRSMHVHQDGHRFPVYPKYKSMYDEMTAKLHEISTIKSVMHCPS